MVNEPAPSKQYSSLLTTPRLTFLLGFAGVVEYVRILSFEWHINEQYEYGFLVPLLGAYLLHQRWNDRPPAEAPEGWLRRFAALGLIGAFALLIPLLVILRANPDWRLLLWLHGGVLCGAASMALYLHGGRPWFGHFLPSLLLFTLAIPWPTQIENQIVLGLMHGVATTVVEMLNWLGIAASQQGNLIRLTHGLVGVEEACSGVRSLQSTLMAAWFMGELFRFPLTGRCGLILLGCLFSLLLNVLRTGILTLIAHFEGGSLTNHLHDPVGQLVSLGSFLGLFLVAWGIHRLSSSFNKGEPAGPAQTATISSPSGASRMTPWHRHFHPWPQFLPVVCLSLLACAHLTAQVWYAWRPQAASDQPALPLHIEWSHLAPAVSFSEITPEIRAQLRYSSGRRADWNEPDGSVWTLFFFTWQSGRISSFAGVHRPETCLPSAGFLPAGSSAPLDFSIGSKTLPFDVSRFTLQEELFYVFFAIWDDHPERQIPLAQTARDRLMLAWHGEKIRARRSLQIIVRNVPSESYARARAAQLLQRALIVHTPTR